jgi:hypothetical protein
VAGSPSPRREHARTRRDLRREVRAERERLGGNRLFAGQHDRVLGSLAGLMVVAGIGAIVWFGGGAVPPSAAPYSPVEAPTATTAPSPSPSPDPSPTKTATPDPKPKPKPKSKGRAGGGGGGTGTTSPGTGGTGTTSPGGTSGNPSQPPSPKPDPKPSPTSPDKPGPTK